MSQGGREAWQAQRLPSTAYVGQHASIVSSTSIRPYVRLALMIGAIPAEMATCGIEQPIATVCCHAQTLLTARDFGNRALQIRLNIVVALVAGKRNAAQYVDGSGYHSV